MNATRRFNLNFSDSAYRTLQERAAARETTIAEHLRYCLALYRYFDEELLKGNHILVERDGRASEVIWL
jgi:hypothetical protein